MKKVILSFMMCLFVAGMAMAQRVYESTGDYVNVRTGPGTKYAVCMSNGANPKKVQLMMGDRVNYAAEKKNGFMKIQCPGKNMKTKYGWVSAQYLKPANDKADTSLSALERQILGRHMLSLQWISWEDFGVCTITKEKDGRLRCVGEQLSKEYPGDYLKIDGYVDIVDAKHLVFNGDITIRVYHLNEGKPYTRSGKYDFLSTQNRKYWRAQNLEVIDATDYVDIYFK